MCSNGASVKFNDVRLRFLDLEILTVLCFLRCSIVCSRPSFYGDLEPKSADGKFFGEGGQFLFTASFSGRFIESNHFPSSNLSFLYSISGVARIFGSEREAFGPILCLSRCMIFTRGIGTWPGHLGYSSSKISEWWLEFDPVFKLLQSIRRTVECLVITAYGLSTLATIVAESPNSATRRFWRQSPFLATVAEFGDKLSPKSATIVSSVDRP